MINYSNEISCHLPLARFLLGLFLNPEVGSSKFLEISMNLYQTTWRYTTKDSLSIVTAIRNSNLTQAKKNQVWASKRNRNYDPILSVHLLCLGL
jgi:hypothetical protein